MKLSPSQKRCFGKALDVCTEVEPHLLMLEKAAQAAPQYDDQVKELRDMADHLRALCMACTAAADDPGQ